MNAPNQTPTFIETLIATALEANTPVLPIDNSCDLSVITGPIRLAPITPAEFSTLYQTGLRGFATKRFAVDQVPATPANFDVDLTGDSVGWIVKIAGAPNIFRPGIIQLAFTGTNVSELKVAILPKSYICRFLVLAVRDNGGVGQPAIVTDPLCDWLLADHSVVGNEYQIVCENITLRDFTRRN